MRPELARLALLSILLLSLAPELGATTRVSSDELPPVVRLVPNNESCGPDADRVVEAIANEKSCHAAVELASQCAWGSGVDIGLTAPAYTICEAELKANRPSKSDQALLKKMTEACARQYGTAQGSMYRSMHRFCELNAIRFLISVTGEI